VFVCLIIILLNGGLFLNCTFGRGPLRAV